MDKTYPPEAWKLLGERLRERRGELGYGFRQRKQFLEDRGGPPPSGKMLDRVENGSRTYYPDATIATLERMYGYRPGSFEAILQGRDPVLLLPPDSPRPLLAAVPPPPVLPDDPTDQQVAQFIIRQVDDTLVMDLWRAWTFRPASREQRLAMVRELSRDPAEVLAEIEAEDRGGERHRGHREQA